ncbi:MAG: DUF3298 and DUF4163 domain-containing protein [Sedimentibacter sp.]|uniref:DUF3298 and DUF4163 domain-containing protein n=1 Tax=Sedimentibacter sp. TaxID=1960295 RepID=UPI002981D59D|nr:DUF3298 and DUF4163 domain-containing protein [Sedimentibacter sp.]MDW5300529.1 DUF3298 and DUF4163 domain-containing protein [Sedimentibacter sp.]
MNKDYCYKANINMKKIEQTFDYNSIEVLKFTIKYPVISMKYNPKAEWLINNQIAMSVSEYIRYADCLYQQAVNNYKYSQTNGFPFNPYEAYMEYTVTYDENCFLSAYVDKYEFTGGAHGNTIRSSDTWELCSGMQLPLYSFFTPGTNYRHLLTEEITKQAEYNLEQNPNIYFDDYKSLILKNFNQNSFYLTPQGMVIYYRQYDIAPYSTGIVEFLIPYATIGWYPQC